MLRFRISERGFEVLQISDIYLQTLNDLVCGGKQSDGNTMSVDESDPLCIFSSFLATSEIGLNLTFQARTLN